ncbi:hypothetical protein JHK84_027709 [Glycine max]|nr:hypothetical protein JHK86_027581 [Glycine max]KAG5151237.1 hypothetical protein JHK84_027709 [Glycine max]
MMISWYVYEPLEKKVPRTIENTRELGKIVCKSNDDEDARLALFRLDSGEVLEYQVFAKADKASTFDLAASWRVYQDNFCPSMRWISDVSINLAP